MRSPQERLRQRQVLELEGTLDMVLELFQEETLVPRKYEFADWIIQLQSRYRQLTGRYYKPEEKK